MNSLRIASRAALRARPAAIRAPLQRRGYAEAVNDKASRPRPSSRRIPRPHPMELSHLLTLRRRTDQAQPDPPPPGTTTTSHTPRDILRPMIIRNKEEEQWRAEPAGERANEPR